MAVLPDIGVALKSLILKILNVFLWLKIPARLDLKQTILFMDGHCLSGQIRKYGDASKPSRRPSGKARKLRHIGNI